MAEVTFCPASDQSLLLQVSERIEPEASGLIAMLVRRLRERPIAGVVDLNPAYSSLLVKFDGLRVRHAEVEAELRELLRFAETSEAGTPREVEIPVLYGGEHGPDLADVAALHGIDSGEVVGLHSQAVYTVCFLGFVPGFAYLGGLPEAIATPRLASPRKRVPPGSVAIGGAQTAVYPFATPGGWRLIGRTPMAMFRGDRDPASLLSIGDRVRFVPVLAERFAELERSL